MPKDLGDRSAEAEACGSLGLALMDAGRLQEAVDRLSAKLAITQEMGNKAEEGRALLALGEVFLAKSRASDGDVMDLHQVSKYREEAFEVMMVQNHTDILHEQLEVCVKVAELNPVFSSLFQYVITDHLEELTYSGAEKLLQYVVRMTEPGPEPDADSSSSSASLLAAGVADPIWKQRRIRLLRAQAFCIYARVKFAKLHAYPPVLGFQEMFVEFVVIKGAVETEEPACGCCKRKNSGGVELQVCKRCKVARFCSKSCLERSWKKEHKHACPVLKMWRESVIKGKPQECSLMSPSRRFNEICEKGQSTEGCHCEANYQYLKQTVRGRFWCHNALH